jgi:hypothetical protein
MNMKKMHRGQWITLCAGIVLVATLVLPWAVRTGDDMPATWHEVEFGYDGGGWFTGSLGLVLIAHAVLIRGKPGFAYSLPAVALAIVLATLLVIEKSTIPWDASYHNLGEIISVGPGIYISLVGTLLAVIGGAQTVPARPPAAGM